LAGFIAGRLTSSLSAPGLITKTAAGDTLQSKAFSLFHLVAGSVLGLI